MEAPEDFCLKKAINIMHSAYEICPNNFFHLSLSVSKLCQAKTLKESSLQQLPSPQDSTPLASNSPVYPMVLATSALVDSVALKVELLEVLRKDITDSFKMELRDALWDDLSTIRLELQAVKT